MKKKYKIPFHPDTGDLLSYSYRDEESGDRLTGYGSVIWKENYTFNDFLTYKGYYHGRSAMRIDMVSKNDGKIYPMFWTIFEKLMKSPDAKPGPTFYGWWTFIKRGDNYSIIPAEDSKEPEG